MAKRGVNRRDDVDWEAVERHYRAGVLSVNQISKNHGVSRVAIEKRALLGGWPRPKVERLVDWSAVESEYRAGLKTLRQIGEEHGVSHTAIMKCAKRRGWVRGPSAPNPAGASGDRSTSLDALDALGALGRSQFGPGFVYVLFIHTGSEFFYKIGLSSCLDDRLKAHRTSSPFEVRLAIAYFVPDMRAEESLLHAMFGDKLVRGEWYRLERQDLEVIAKRSLLA
jgi:hypothetical protein